MKLASSKVTPENRWERFYHWLFPNTRLTRLVREVAHDLKDYPQPSDELYRNLKTGRYGPVTEQEIDVVMKQLGFGHVSGRRHWISN